MCDSCKIADPDFELPWLADLEDDESSPVIRVRATKVTDPDMEW